MSTRYMSQTTALAALVIFDQPVYMWSEKRGRAGYADEFEDRYEDEMREGKRNDTHA